MLKENESKIILDRDKSLHHFFSDGAALKEIVNWQALVRDIMFYTHYDIKTLAKRVNIDFSVLQEILDHNNISGIDFRQVIRLLALYETLNLER